jgi:hypothetical protein
MLNSPNHDQRCRRSIHIKLRSLKRINEIQSPLPGRISSQIRWLSGFSLAAYSIELHYGHDQAGTGILFSVWLRRNPGGGRIE